MTTHEKTVCEINYDSLEWHELDKLARKAGYNSAMIAANEAGYWRATISEFRQFLIEQTTPALL